MDLIDWDKTPIVPAVAQDVGTKEVLMLAYVNKEALELTIESGFAHYYSRSRNSLWKKGESSGNIQSVLEIRLDCDADAILYLVKQTGVACHTGSRNCFYRKIK